ncbi:MAG: YraN family protein [Alphaproteobacteria bacterium]|nr:YraN family protein [Rickettsiales bacterium]
MRNYGLKNNSIGLIGEKMAIDYFNKAGYTFICERYTGSVGEIDLIFSNEHKDDYRNVGGKLIFIEVKSTVLKSGQVLDGFDIASVVKKAQVKRIIATMEEFTACNRDKYLDFQIQLDLFFLFMPKNKIIHIENISLDDLS